MTIRITGTSNSGIDTDSIIKELLKASSQKKTDLEKDQTKLSWQQDAWKSLNTKVYSFFNTTLGNMKYSEAFNKKSTTVADETIASVVASDTAVAGTQTLSVKQLAKAGYLTGGKLSNDKSITSSTKLNSAGLNAGMTGTGTFDLTVAGKTTSISVTGDSTVGSVMTQLTNAGVQASFDATNQRIFISVKNSGAGNDFDLSATNEDGMKALSSMGLVTADDFAAGSEYATLAGYKGADDATTLLNLQNAGIVASTAASRAATMQSEVAVGVASVTSLKDLNDNATTGYKKLLGTITSSTTYTNMTGGTSTEKLSNAQTQMTLVSDKLEYLTLKNKAPGSLTPTETTRLAELETRSTNESWGTLDKDTLVADKNTLTTTISQIKSAINYETKIAETDKKIYDAQVNVFQKADRLNDYYDTLSTEQKTALATTISNNTGYMSTAQTDAQNYATTYSDPTAAPIAELPGTLIGDVENDLVDLVNMSVASSSYVSSTAVRVAGQDAKIALNGADFSSTSNSFTVNGLTITAKSVSAITGGTAENPVYATTSVNTDKDVSGVYNMIKNFFTGYNSLIKEMDTMYNAASSKGYEPLSSDEKSAMTDSQVEDWEKKIKTSLLRRDSTLGTITSAMKENMLSEITIDGKDYTLTDFGIETLGYFKAPENEHGVYHINGDSTDSSTSGNKDVLKSTIASNPDLVMNFFTKLTGNLYDELNTQMRSTEYRSVYNIYDDKKMQTDYKEYTKKIKEQTTKLTALEDRYYSQFSAMEVALSKLNSSQSAISGLLG